MRRHLQTYQRCWADEQRKESNYQILYQSRQCPKGPKIQQPNQSQDSVQNAKLQPAQVKGLTKQRGIILCPQQRENALKVALIIQRRYKRRAGSKPAPNTYCTSEIHYANDVTM